MTGILIGASIPYEPLVRPLAIPVSLFYIQVGAQLLVTGWMHRRQQAAPFRISSTAKGERIRPFLLTIVEDVVAVDGGAGASYRKRLVARYEASERFRRMIIGLNWFWGVGAVLDGVATLVVLWTVPQDIGYGIGECCLLPFFFPPSKLSPCLGIDFVVKEGFLTVGMLI